MKFEISVPATISNLGPGFDTLGLAIDRRLRLVFEQSPAVANTSFAVEGEYADDVPDAPENLVFRAVSAAAKGPFALTMKNDIPLARGLGSSSAANAASLAAVRAMKFFSDPKNSAADDVSASELLRPAIFNEGIALEGHPDNITPCLFGGFVTAMIGGGGDGAFMNIPFPEHMRLHLIIPDIVVETKKAREILPASYPRSDVVRNLQNLSFMVAQFCQNSSDPQKNPIFSNLRFLFGDRIHQDYRLSLCPPCAEAIEFLNSSEKISGAFLSGSGTTICAMAPDGVGAEMEEAVDIFSKKGIGAAYAVHSIEYSGLRIKRR